ncbi:MAG TPA: UDP-N-acetylmuramate dehydrogenase [Ignavibacteria bacterium]|nr:UDP-N-acetylmuramate dehydrogenase [Ignavibacteria bacterium]
MNIKENYPLSSLTTIGLGGPAKYIIECESPAEIKEAINFSREKNLKFYVLSGGSNVVFPDKGFDGVILLLRNKFQAFEVLEQDSDSIILKINAGENWDSFVKFAVENGYSGIECLSGIPGSVGATPVQNVGAYGQEIKDVFVSLNAIDVNTLEEKSFSNEECKFDYRQSRFKKEDKEKYVITDVTLKLSKTESPKIKYPELQKYISENTKYDSTDSLKEKLKIVRESVIEIRKRKSMVIDIHDPNTRSCGSFFMNPVLDEISYQNFLENAKELNPPSYKSGDRYKIPAAWLIENSGFYKGYKYMGVGISTNHTLALVNYNGTTTQLIELANLIRGKVFEKFGLKLTPEPEIIA